MEWSQVAALVGIAVGIGGIGSTVVFQSMVRGQRDSVEFLTAANAGLREALRDSEVKREENVRRSAVEVGELRGKIEILEGSIVESITLRVADEVAERLATRLDVMLRGSRE